MGDAKNASPLKWTAWIQQYIEVHCLARGLSPKTMKAYQETLEGVNLVTIRDLLGHRGITRTQIYLHTTAEDLRQAANRHPVERLINRIEDLLPCGKVPFQWAPGERHVGSG